jgi:oxidase EvaA
VLADVRQSEQGSWFNQKRNRNVILEVAEDVPLLPGFHWLTLGQVHRLLAVDDLINMDARTVLSCFPFAGTDLVRVFASGGADFREALVQSYCDGQRSRHGMREILSWITEARTGGDVRTRPIPLAELRRWRRADGRISHESGLFFDVIGVRVEAAGREVATWHQPMIAPVGTGLVALLVTRVSGVLHVLVHARVEPGYVDVVELAPTVQCTPANYDWLPPAARPRFLDDALGLRAERILFDTVLAEEGGRFYHARNRYLIGEVEMSREYETDHFRWVTLRQLVELLRHSYYLNVQLRSLVACLHSLSVSP